MLTACSSSQSAGAAASRIGMDEAEAEAKGPPRGHVERGSTSDRQVRVEGLVVGSAYKFRVCRLQRGRPPALVAVDARHPRHRGVRRRPSGQMGLKAFGCHKGHARFFGTLVSTSHAHTNRRAGFLHSLLAPHTSGPRDVPRCGALSLLQKDAALQGGRRNVC
jgi:hypothetical protein